MVKNKKKINLSKAMTIASDSREERKGGSVMSWKDAGVKNLEFFKAKVGNNKINIIPYEVKSENHPAVVKGLLDVGDYDYVLKLWVHKRVGVNEQDVVCLKENYGKPCPICEEMKRLKDNYKMEEGNALKPTQRVFYNVEDLDDGGKVKVFETSHFLFEKELIDEMLSQGVPPVYNFADVEDGSIVKFRGSKVSKGGFEFMEFKSFSFLERDEELDSKLVEGAISFDELINVLTYEEIEGVLNGVQVTKKTAPKAEEEVEEDEIPSKPRKNKKVVVEEEDEEEYEDNDTEDEEVDEEEEVEEVKKPTKTKNKGGKNTCPYGYNFGTDSDEYDECADCECWEKCAKG